MSEAGMGGPTLAASYVLLGLLEEGPRHGYDLARAFAHDSDLGQAVRLEMSMLYNLLKRLERDGLINGQEIPGTRHRRLFTLSETGRALFEQWLTTPVR